MEGGGSRKIERQTQVPGILGRTKVVLVNEDMHPEASGGMVLTRR